jgi:L-amino acid N-acyltransferase YncA
MMLIRFYRIGVAKLLLNEIVKQAREFKYRSIIAVVSSENEASIAFFKQSGFKEVGRMKEVGLKFGRNLDVTTLQLLL